MGFLSSLGRPGPSGFGSATTAEQATFGLDLVGRTYLVTGSGSGLGKETARVLALRGARVFALARNNSKARQISGEIPGEVVPIGCDLADIKSIQAAIRDIVATEVDFDAFIGNAGVMALPSCVQRNGFELQFFTNHVGHAALINGLIHRLKSNGRVVVLSSAAHEMTYKEGIQFDNLSGSNGYSPWKAYGQSKLCNLLFARYLATRLPISGQTSNAVHPGVIVTPLMRNLNPAMMLSGKLVSPFFMKTVEQGAATQVYVATHPSLAEVNGMYFADCNLKKSSEYGRDMRLAAELWRKTEEIIKAIV
ncbi:MAG: short-chain dehydrogenase/reductase SDR [Acidiferrobacteraceae bacterium]|nr:short-chain dehydrogenase/reductase SDR [Acidiferrobacteraceae bacterium]|tara:strand:+ start:405 stop:1325 length:921 start_codon:yes stop_codon:yes gene_type:complete